ncbi:MAG: hypothetical protein MUD12_16960, partial [Spirochaetes bacterium]|nr:hypothetical protein [Spirochaetota bacterium]
MNLKTANFPLQVAIATLLYNVLHILAWELPIAVRLSWDVNIIGDIIVIAASTLGMILIAFGKKAGLILAVIPASWAIFFQWFIVYFILGYKEPNGVWWYPLFPIFQGINIVFFCILAYRNLDRQSLPEQKTGNGLRSPSYYLYAASAFLL